ncbi:hypothetical protein HZC08_01425, partial [Candidatus Micrarchaeota archaeon]|nr:hypothetical protein [Candidatus Micrarchaeota archaeon]
MIFSFSFAAAACEENAFNFVTKNIGSEIGLVLSLTVLVIALTYMAGQFLSKAEYSVFSKD